GRRRRACRKHRSRGCRKNSAKSLDRVPYTRSPKRAEHFGSIWTGHSPKNSSRAQSVPQLSSERNERAQTVPVKEEGVFLWRLSTICFECNGRELQRAGWLRSTADHHLD